MQPTIPDIKLRARAALEMKRRRTGGLSLMNFIPAMSPGLRPPHHLQPLVDAIERAETEPIQVLVSVPPRHGKTETICHGLARFVHRNPDKTIAYTSYAADFAHSKSVRIRQIAAKAGTPASPDMNKREEWRTSLWGGGLATGIGGPLTGHGANLLVVDDPFKNRVEAESPRHRQKVQEWFNDVAYTRLEPGNSSIIVCHTRWHEDDLYGYLKKTGGWEIINLPAIADDGAALWPEKFNEQRLDKIRRQIGEYSWASLYQGEPRPRGGTLFRDVNFYDSFPDKSYEEGVGVDLAYTARTYADYSVAIRGRLTDDGYLYLVDLERGQMEAPRFGRVLRRWRDENTWAPFVFLGSGVEKGSVSFLNDYEDIGLDFRSAQADKFVRAQGVAAAWNDGKVLVPRDASWVDDFLSEVLEFSGVGDKNDDQVDALAALFHALDPNDDGVFL